MAEQKSLNQVAAEIFEDPPLAFRFDTFGHDGQSQILAEIDHGTDEAVVVFDVGDERLSDFEDVHR